MAEQVDFYQIVYKQEHLNECYPFAKTYFNDSLTEFFENAVIKSLVMGSEAEKISVCSWKLKRKMRWNVCRPRPLTEEVLKTDFKVMSFTCNTKVHQFLAAAKQWHPGILEILKNILAHLGEPMPSEVKNPIYQNHFCATSEVYRQYVFEYLSPAMILMNSDAELRPMCWADSNYSQLAQSDAATPEYLKEKIGVPYYPMHAFALERLFSIFCHNRKIKVDYL